MSQQTTIAIKKETREKLKELGKKGESYDFIIEHMIKILEKEELFKEHYRMLREGKFVPLSKVKWPSKSE